jgi:diguanylate cyclase (GGDEF)-like protein
VAAHLRTRHPLSVIFLDLDRFKEINDTHGHLAGSSTLAEFGALFARVAGNAGATVARYGGDEFVALLPDTGREKALRIAERVRAETASHVFLADRWGEDQAPLRLAGIVTASIGVSTLETPPSGELDRQARTGLGVQLLQCADQAMYAAKVSGKNRVTYLPVGACSPGANNSTVAADRACAES